MTDTFTKTSDNLIICINENNAKSTKELITTKGCNNIDCSSKWKEHQQKIIEENIGCTTSCFNNSIYIYEYGRKCYESCPDGTIIIDYLCIDYNNKTDITTSLEKETEIETETDINTTATLESYYMKTDITQFDENTILLNEASSENYFLQSDLKTEVENTYSYIETNSENYFIQSDAKTEVESSVLI